MSDKPEAKDSDSRCLSSLSISPDVFLFPVFPSRRAEKKERSRLKTVRVTRSQDRSVSRKPIYRP